MITDVSEFGVLPNAHTSNGASTVQIGSEEALLDRNAVESAITLLMLADMSRWCRRIVEKIRLEADNTVRTVVVEMRVPTADELAGETDFTLTTLRALGKVRVVLPFAYRVRSHLLSNANTSSSHKPFWILNHAEGNEQTERALTVALKARQDGDTDDSFVRLANEIRKVHRTHYVQYAAVETTLGETVTIETTTRLARNESATDPFASLRTSWGWKQNRHRIRTELPSATCSYHFEFEVPNGFFLKQTKVRRVDGSDRRLVATHQQTQRGAPEAHVFIPGDAKQPEDDEAKQPEDDEAKQPEP